MKILSDLYICKTKSGITGETFGKNVLKTLNVYVHHWTAENEYGYRKTMDYPHRKTANLPMPLPRNEFEQLRFRSGDLVS